ncbi:hypothetical protein GCM10025863_08610 [Microbacterium suwonense]|uniref:Uncharacterized protein n=2 Tax=Microbacterium suwonense TaxID=683047 RepID=A0ABN6X193_9MICO|nr:hypothetical protein GCM10025863_08610 [Microbacterium suwonense]
MVAAGLMLAGCASPPASGGHSTSVPSAAAEGMLRTPRAVTVLDAGDGAKLCLGAIATSLPPQCGGPGVIGWDWAEWSGAYTEAAGVRWGSFTLTGSYDADAFTFRPADVRPGNEGGATSAGSWSGEADFSTPCDPPEGGWQVRDAARTTAESMQRVFERAMTLPGYAASWVDRSRIPSVGAEATPEQQLAETAPHPELTIVNVTVVGDVTAAETALTEVWGGMLCVTAAERTEADLLSVMSELMPQSGSHQVLMAAPNTRAGRIDLQVIHDDGALQQEMDQAYGVGTVIVRSVLQPVG